VNEQRTAVCGPPRPVLDVLDARDDQGGPGLTRFPLS
jgi:hypothetical protein